TPPSTATSVESCTVSSSLPIPTRNKQDMQPNSPLGVFSSTLPQLGQIEVCSEGDCICYTLSCGHCRFQFTKCSQHFMRTHNEPFSVVAMCVSNPVNVSRRMRANHGANPKGSKEGRRMNDTQTLILIHTVAWPILIWALSKTWSRSRNAVRFHRHEQ